MEIIIFDKASLAAEHAAKLIIDLNKEKNGKFNLGVATGRTMDSVYLNLVEKALAEKLSFSNVKTFALDEYIGLEKNSINSYREYLKFHLHSPLGFKEENIFIPEVGPKGSEASSESYEKSLEDAGRQDLQLLGIGLNGHIALNEPGSCKDSKTRIVALTETTKNSNKVLFKNEKIPLVALTMGVKSILEAKKIVLIATGESKAEIIKEMLEGKIGSHLPASFLRDHKDCILILDKESSKLLK